MAEDEVQVRVQVRNDAKVTVGVSWSQNGCEVRDSWIRLL